MIKKPVSNVPVTPLPETYVSLDFETTALSPASGRVIEIGAVRYTNGDPVAIFNCMVYQDPAEFPITEEVTKLTGHTQEDVLKGVDEAMAMDMLLSFCGGYGELIVGQNILFDYSFLNAAAERNGWAIQFDLLDTLTIARDRKPYPHKLIDLARHYNITTEGFHSAYYDAMTAGEVLLQMVQEDISIQPGKRAMDYVNVIGYKNQYGPPEWAPDWVKLVGQGSSRVNHEPKDRMVVCASAFNDAAETLVQTDLTKTEADKLAMQLNATKQADNEFIYRVESSDYELDDNMPF